MVWLGFRRRNWPICWTASTGEIHVTHSGQVAQDNDQQEIFRESFGVICDSILCMQADSEKLPDDIDMLKAEVAAGRARAAADQALIADQQLQIAKLRHQLYGQRSERTTRLIEQMELGLEELEAAATEDEIAAEQASARTTNVAAFIRRRPSRQPFPEHLRRERVVEPAPATCLCCGGVRLRKLGEDVTETLEVVPRRWKVIQHVREKFTCRDCSAQPFHAGGPDRRLHGGADAAV